VPPHLAARAKIGSRVTVSFGPRRIGGYIVGFAEKSCHDKVKQVLAIDDAKPYITRNLLKLAAWMAKYYCATIEQAVRTILPGPVRNERARFKQQIFVEVVETRNAGAEQQPDATEEAAPAISPKLTKRQQEILAEIQKRGRVLLSELQRDLHVTAAPIKALATGGLVKMERGDLRRDPLANKTILRTNHLKLMPSQEKALKMIVACMEARSPAQYAAASDPCASGRAGSNVVLLHGVTGSGKTEVYLQAIDHVLRQGRGAIVLVPEISLTPQTVEGFVARFGDRVAVLHSHLSSGERHDEWHRIRDGQADIVIGARSAIFAPLEKLGLIVVDEEHEPSYKQDESPRYSARDVAVMRGVIEGCPVVLGSATPALESWYNTRNGKYKLAMLPHRADNRKMPLMRIVDMRIETERNNGKPSVLSGDLMDAMRLRLDRGEQTMLFLNRRGYSTSLICQKCGFVAKCDHCSVSLTYHRSEELLRCHICGWSGKVPQQCPTCNDPAFKFAGVGTQRVEIIVKKCFPSATIQRMDSDVTTRKDDYDRILGEFRTGKTHILIGTQMIAKGLHFPNVTLVGVIYADLSLHMPDFRASERTFQLLAQVAGRAGRGEVPGEVFVQTYTPSNPAIQAARQLDYDRFIDQEIEARKELKYPPHTHLICVTLKSQSEGKVAYCSTMLVRALRPKLPPGVIVSEAMPSPLSRAEGFYRYQVVLRYISTIKMTEPLMKTLEEFKMPREVSWTVDVDATSII
ncbi:MAG: primosomal protein N', partial [Verrucomicrobia bacterium]|nr:primosomal protein N' [Verrucomicrobiota bacterium]